MATRKYLSVLLGLALGTVCFGQTYTEDIQRAGEGGGTLVLHQSKTITDLVNGKATNTPAAVKARKPAAGSAAKAGQTLVPDTLGDSISVTTLGQKTMVDGYRIQVYSGGNTRRGKTEAVMMGQKVKGYLDDVAVYTHFVSPHWICRVGDFRTYEEASEYFKRLKETGSFPEAIIVRSRVAVYN